MQRLPSRALPALGVSGALGDAVHDTTYRANDAIEVRIRDLSQVGAVLDTMMGRGRTDTSPVQFKATDISSAQADALREATVRARAQKFPKRFLPR